MGFKLFICSLVVVFTTAISFWGVRTLGSMVANRRVIAVWSFTSSFVITLFIYVMTKDSLYGYFFAHPERYETALQAAERGMYLCVLMLTALGAALSYLLWEEGMRCRYEERRRRCRATRTLRRQR